MMRFLIIYFVRWLLSSLDEESIPKVSKPQIMKIHRDVSDVPGFRDLMRRKIRRYRNSAALAQNENQLWYYRGALMECERLLLTLDKSREQWTLQKESVVQ